MAPAPVNLIGLSVLSPHFLSINMLYFLGDTVCYGNSWLQVCSLGRGEEMVESSMMAKTGAKGLFLYGRKQSPWGLVAAQGFAAALRVAGCYEMLPKEGLKDVALSWEMSAVLKLQTGHHMKERTWPVVKALNWALWDCSWLQSSCGTLGKSLNFSTSQFPLVQGG